MPYALKEGKPIWYNGPVPAGSKPCTQLQAKAAREIWLTRTRPTEDPNLVAMARLAEAWGLTESGIS